MNDIESEILKKFYRTKLRKGEDVIDNRDSVIAKELGLTVGYVSEVISKDLDDKIEMVNKSSISKEEIEAIDRIEKDKLTSQVYDLKAKIKRIKYTNEILTKTVEELNEAKNFLKSDYYKLIKCRQLILEGVGVNEIAKSIGYKNRSTVYDLVLRAEGITFTEYKKQLLKLN